MNIDDDKSHMTNTTAVRSFTTPRQLGRSALSVGALGLASSYGAPARAYEEAFEKGCTYFYWGSIRREGMQQAIHALAPQHREKLVVAVQSYSRFGAFLNASVHRALKGLKLDYADVLLLGWFNALPPPRIMDAALRLKEKGVVRKIAISCHHRPSFAEYIRDPRFDIIMTRYNAAHRGAEREVFPSLKDVPARPGVVTYTSTRWGFLIDPKYTPAGLRTPTAADCYRFSLSNPDVDVCLTGPASDEEMRANLKALEQGPLSVEEMQWIRTVGDHVHRLTSRKWYANPFMQRKQ